MNHCYNSKPLSDCTDEELSLLVDYGNMAAFSELSERFLPAIKAKAGSFNVAGFEFNDFVQEGLLSLYICTKTYNSSRNTSFKTFCDTCILNRMLSLCRTANSDKNIPLKSYVSYDEYLSETSSSLENPEQKLIDEEMFNDTYKLIRSRLSELEYNVLVRYINNKSYTDISRDLEISVKSVNNAMQRIRRKLKDIYI
ncbi:MAG: sigma-70 family RNA polymerase sigma factor [Clostridiales bacterium]|nr:sigma-70 family RNA polymerase sigma factor [Clostridiales bacterium]